MTDSQPFAHLNLIASQINDANHTFALEAKEVEIRYEMRKRKLEEEMVELETAFASKRRHLEDEVEALQNELKRNVKAVNEERRLALSVHATEIGSLRKHILELVSGIDSVLRLADEGDDCIIDDNVDADGNHDGIHSGTSTSMVSENKRNAIMLAMSNDDDEGDSGLSPVSITTTSSSTLVTKSNKRGKVNHSNKSKPSITTSSHLTYAQTSNDDRTTRDDLPELDYNSSSSSTSTLSTSAFNNKKATPLLPTATSSKPRDLDRHFESLIDRWKTHKREEDLEWLVELFQSNRQRHVATLNKLLPTRLIPRALSRKVRCGACGETIEGNRHYAGTEIDSERRCVSHPFCKACGEYIYCRFSDVCPGGLSGASECEWGA